MRRLVWTALRDIGILGHGGGSWRERERNEVSEKLAVRSQGKTVYCDQLIEGSLSEKSSRDRQDVRCISLWIKGRYVLLS